MNTEEHDELWRLLGKAKEPSVSPMFSRNILREVRDLQEQRPSLLVWLRRYWQIPLAAACTVIVGFGILSPKNEIARQAAEPDRLLVMAERVSESPDYQVINHLDELLDSEENSVWLDQNVY